MEQEQEQDHVPYPVVVSSIEQHLAAVRAVRQQEQEQDTAPTRPASLWSYAWMKPSDEPPEAGWGWVLLILAGVLGLHLLIFLSMNRTLGGFLGSGAVVWGMFWFVVWSRAERAREAVERAVYVEPMIRRGHWTGYPGRP